MSRIAKVIGIVSSSDLSRPLLISSLISELARVLFRAWIWSPGWAARISSSAAATGTRRSWTRPVAGDLGRDPDGALVGRDQPGLGRRLRRVDDVIEDRSGRSVDGRLQGRHRAR
jgi:hypothetical protein